MTPLPAKDPTMGNRPTDDLQTREQGLASLTERLESRIEIEKACGNYTERPMNHVRIMMDALTRISALEEALKGVHAARLRRDGSDPGYGWNVTKLNRAINDALPLIDVEAPAIEPRLAHIAEGAERIARRMGGRFVLARATLDGAGEKG